MITTEPKEPFNTIPSNDAKLTDEFCRTDFEPHTVSDICDNMPINIDGSLNSGNPYIPVHGTNVFVYEMVYVSSALNSFPESLPDGKLATNRGLELFVSSLATILESEETTDQADPLAPPSAEAIMDDQTVIRKLIKKTQHGVAKGTIQHNGLAHTSVYGPHFAALDVGTLVFLTHLSGNKSVINNVRGQLLTVRANFLRQLRDEKKVITAAESLERLSRGQYEEDAIETAKSDRDVIVASVDHIAHSLTLLTLSDAINNLEQNRQNPQLIQAVARDMLSTAAQPDNWRDIVMSIKGEKQSNPTLDPILEQEPAPISLHNLPTMKVNWKVLPTGRLNEHARTLAERATSKSKNEVVVDPERLIILENIRQWWGEDYAYYAEGQYDEDDIIESDNGEGFADQYIMLVLREHNKDGTIKCEHVVAESPIVGPNALYIQRYDVNHWTWDNMMKLHKPDARMMGAKPIKHEAAADENLIDIMTQKVQILLTCNPSDFLDTGFNGSKNGEVRTRLRRQRAVGAKAVRITQAVNSQP